MLHIHKKSLAVLLLCSALVPAAASAGEVHLPQYDTEALCSTLAGGMADPAGAKQLCLRVEKYFNGSLLAMHPAGEKAKLCIAEEKTGSYASLYFCMKDAKVPSAPPESAFGTPDSTQDKPVTFSFPEYNIEAYCKKTAEAVQGGAAFELMCRENEQQDKAALLKMEIGQAEMRQCLRQTYLLKGGYTLFKMCIDAEQKAMKELAKSGQK